MTKEEFEKRYAARSYMTVEELRALDVVIESCDCGDEICQGWKVVT